MAVFLGGCASVSVQQVATFGSAAGELSRAARAGLRAADESAIERKVYELAVNPTLAPTDETFTGLFTGAAADPRLKEALELRLRALDALGTYAESLRKIARADLGEEMDAGARELYGALAGLRAMSPQLTRESTLLSDQSLGMISAAVAGLGKAISDEHRRKALEEIVVAADPAIQRVAEALGSELGEDSPLARYAKQSLQNQEGSLRQAYNAERKAPGSTFEARLAALERMRRLHARVERLPRLFEDVSAGVRELAQAHAALNKAATQHDWKLPELASAVGQLADRAQSAWSFSAPLTAGQ